MICASGVEVVRNRAVGRVGLAGALITLIGTSCALLAPLDEIAPKSPGLTDSGSDQPNTDGPTGGSGGSGGDASTACVDHSECSRRNFDRPSRCIGGACVPLETTECLKAFTGKSGADEVRDFNDDNAIILGAYANIDKDLTSPQEILNYRLVLNELSGPAQGGLPGPDGTKRPLVLVVCDNTPADGGQGIDNSMKHLVNELGVPGVLAALDTATLLRTFGEFGRPHGVFFLSPFNSNRQLAVEPDNSLLWHMLGQPTDMVPAYKSLLAKVEKRILASKPGEKLKVALVWTTDAFNDELTQAAVVELMFNGMGVAANERDGNYKSVKLDANSDIANEVSALRSFKPHVVISMADNSFISRGMLSEIESNFGAEDRVHYILSPFNRGATSAIKLIIEETLFLESGSGTPTAHQRFMGVNAAGAEDQTLYNHYYTRMINTFDNVQKGRENLYDALYFLAYAIHAAGSSTVLSGKGIAQAMPKLMSGTIDFDVGPEERVDALAFLSTTQSIRLIGTLGPPDFELQGGSRVDTGGIYCFNWDRNSQGVITATEHPDVMRYDLKQNQLRFSALYPTAGTAPCLEELRGP